MTGRRSDQDLNPYATPQLIEAPSKPGNLRPLVTGLLLLAAVLVIGFGNLLQMPSWATSRLAWVLVYFLPALHWEVFCRQTPRLGSRILSVLSTLFRCVVVYMGSHVACYLGGCTAVLAINPPAAWTPQPTYVLGVCILGGVFALVRFDYWMARKTWER